MKVVLFELDSVFHPNKRDEGHVLFHQIVTVNRNDQFAYTYFEKRPANFVTARLESLSPTVFGPRHSRLLIILYRRGDRSRNFCTADLNIFWRWYLNSVTLTSLKSDCFLKASHAAKFMWTSFTDFGFWSFSWTLTLDDRPVHSSETFVLRTFQGFRKVVSEIIFLKTDTVDYHFERRNIVKQFSKVMQACSFTRMRISSTAFTTATYGAEFEYQIFTVVVQQGHPQSIEGNETELKQFCTSYWAEIFTSKLDNRRIHPTMFSAEI